MTETLWDWSVAAYAAPGVSETCLQLQDTADQNVPLLLWAAWTAQSGRLIDADDVEAACDTARAWSNAAIEPLRDVRRTLKAAIPDIDDAPRLAVREQVKAIELACERHLLDALQAVAPPQAGPPQPPLDALIAVARVWARVLPRPALTTLAERLSAAY